MTVILSSLITLLAWQFLPAGAEAWVSANKRITATLLAAGSLLAALLSIALGGTREVPVTQSLLQQAAQTAEADGGGYDYACRLYGASRQILCQGQGPSVAFLVSPNGQLQLEPGTGHDAAYLLAVLHHRALDHKKALRRDKRAALETVPLAAVEPGGVDPQLDAMVAEREELHDLAELAKDVLSQRELEIMVLSRQGVARAEIGARYGLSVRSVERCLGRAQRKLDEGVAVMSAWGRCGMLALTISDIKTGRIGPGDPRYERGITHLKRCRYCRVSTPGRPSRRPETAGE